MASAKIQRISHTLPDLAGRAVASVPAGMTEADD